MLKVFKKGDVNKRSDPIPSHLRSLAKKHGIDPPGWFVDSAERSSHFGQKNLS